MQEFYALRIEIEYFLMFFLKRFVIVGQFSNYVNAERDNVSEYLHPFYLPFTQNRICRSQLKEEFANFFNYLSNASKYAIIMTGN